MSHTPITHVQPPSLIHNTHHLRTTSISHAQLYIYIYSSMHTLTYKYKPSTHMVLERETVESRDSEDCCLLKPKLRENEGIGYMYVHTHTKPNTDP